MGKYVIKETAKGYTFSLKGTNGQVIGVSELYATKQACMNGIESVKTIAPDANFEDQTAEGFKTETNPKFEMYTDKAGEFRFRLKARNGQAVLASEGYTTKANCKNGIESVRKNSGSEIEQ